MGPASLCQQCLVTGKALWDRAICRKKGETEFKIKPCETLRFRSSKAAQQLGQQAWIRTGVDCCSENFLGLWFMTKIHPPRERRARRADLNDAYFYEMRWDAPGSGDCGEGPWVAQPWGWAQGERTSTGYAGGIERRQFQNHSLQ